MKHLLRHLFTPHETNNHRAKLLHHSSLLILVGLLFGSSFLFSYEFDHDKSVLGISYSVTPEELLILTNQQRQEHNLAPLSMNGALTVAATRKAEDMFAKDYWAHIAPDGTTPWYFIKSSGYEYLYAGENLARGYTTSSDVIAAWMASPSHRENMLSPNYKEIGFAIKDGTLTGDDTVLVVEELGAATNSTASTSQPKDVAQPIVLTPTPTQSVNLATALPTPTAIPPVVPESNGVLTPTPVVTSQVQAFRNDPLINKPQAQKNIALIVIISILALLIVDILMTRRKNVVRILSHNIDHIIFFGMLLLLIFLLTRGGVL